MRRILLSLLALASSVSAFVPMTSQRPATSTTTTTSSTGGTTLPPLVEGRLPWTVSSSRWLTQRSMAPLDKDESKSPMKIIISGAPASGKGTQCEIIKEKFGVVHLSTGDMLRAAVAAKTQVGMAAKEYMDSGRLVPDNVIIGVVSWLPSSEKPWSDLSYIHLVYVSTIPFFHSIGLFPSCTIPKINRSRIDCPKRTVPNRVGYWMGFLVPPPKPKPWKKPGSRPIVSCF